MSQIVQVHKGPLPHRRGDVVFIHGIDSGWDKAWRYDQNDQDSSWPRWFSSSHADLGVWSIDYEAAIFDWKRYSMRGDQRAINLLAQLKANKLGARPLIFIAHSMGGLLIKRIFFEEGQPGKEALVTQATRGIVFLSTPHRGSSVATLAQRLFGGLLLGKNVRELRRDEDELARLHDWFRKLVAHRRFKVLAFSENRLTGGLQVVSRKSADPDIVGIDFIPVDADHASICKPDKGAMVATTVHDFVEACLRQTKAPNPPADGDRQRIDDRIRHAADQLVKAFRKLDDEILKNFRAISDFRADWLRKRKQRRSVAHAIETFSDKHEWIDAIHESMHTMRDALEVRKEVHPDDLVLVESLYKTGLALLEDLNASGSKVTPFPSIEVMKDFVSVVRSDQPEDAAIEKAVKGAEDLQMLLSPARLQDLGYRRAALTENHRRRYDALKKERYVDRRRSRGMKVKLRDQSTKRAR